MQTKLRTKIETCNHSIQFFNDNDTCPSCSQHISEDHKSKITTELENNLATENDKLKDLEKMLQKMQRHIEISDDLMDQIRTKNIEVSTLLNTVKVLTTQNKQLQAEIDATNKDSGNIDQERQKMKDMAEDAINQVTHKSSLLDKRAMQDVASMLLKDNGIKTAIIREYLPVMNKLINKYLAAMDFYVKFELDESFQEAIKSRGRDDFTYDSFSEGEKRRLDLAILFTWRQIAKMKNSVNTNIMILDEILDGALDTGGIDFFLNIMNQFGEQTNVFVISHKVDQMVDRFDHVVRVEKKNDFSVISA